MKRPIFLLGAHKSGTSLLRSLLDGHPDLFVVPIEEHVFKHLGFGINYPYQRQVEQKFTHEEINSKFVEWIKICNSSSDVYGDSVANNIFNVSQFESSINGLTGDNGVNYKVLINNYFESIYSSLYNQKFDKNKRVVSKSVENVEFAFELKKLYPDAKFIHIIRNPYASLVALRKYKTRNKEYPILLKPLKAINNSFYYLEKNKRFIEEYHVITYEDLVTNTRGVMNEISNFLELEFTDKLLTPNFMGDIWKGNSTSDKKFKGVDSSPINMWEKEIKPYEIYIVNMLFTNQLEKFNYTKKTTNRNIYRIMKGENLHRYILNRTLKFLAPHIV